MAARAAWLTFLRQRQLTENLGWQPEVAMTEALSRIFDAYRGQYVIHCHILAHEDRGMMQLVQIADPK